MNYVTTPWRDHFHSESPSGQKDLNGALRVDRNESSQISDGVIEEIEHRARSSNYST